RDTLADRLREDYQAELADLFRLQIEDCRSQIERPLTHRDGETPVAPDHTAGDIDPTTPSNPQSAISNLQSLDAPAANEEIAELRRKLSRLGSVNLEALQELNDLDVRARDLRVQFDDLTAAKKSLEEIITKINQDSRKLFSESFQPIRTPFQELFRKLFGGGRADVVFEDENDILESGIEIIAQPPGKELRSISLMSGGEKTLTAVALLLAIFRSKPSP